jgi:hypothetical protein
MKYEKLKLYLCFAGMLCLNGLKAQESIPASGGNAWGSGGSESYTIGQVVYTTNNGVNGSVAQGMQQPYEISALTDLVENIGIELCLAYPNPANEYVIVKILNLPLDALSYQLKEMNGKSLECADITNNETTIKTNRLVAGTYFLTVFQHDKEAKTFKLIIR